MTIRLIVGPKPPTNRRRARKAHQCDLCGGTIQSGAIYHWWTWFGGGAPWRGKAHLICDASSVHYPPAGYLESLGLDLDGMTDPDSGSIQWADVWKSYAPFQFDPLDAQPETWDEAASWFDLDREPRIETWRCKGPGCGRLNKLDASRVTDLSTVLLQAHCPHCQAITDQEPAPERAT